ncbi:MAG: response regulator [Parcubacteria group bacterium]
MKILVIDDNPFNLEAAKKQLTEAGHEVTAIDNFEEAANILGGGDPLYGHHVEKFEAVLSDLLMCPEEKWGQLGSEFTAQMPFGLVLVLLAALNGAKYAAVATDTNHHKHPMSHAIDGLGCMYWPQDMYFKESQEAVKPKFKINGTVVGIWHAPLEKGYKNWGKILAALLAVH